VFCPVGGVSPTRKNSHSSDLSKPPLGWGGFVSRARVRNPRCSRANQQEPVTNRLAGYDPALLQSSESIPEGFQYYCRLLLGGQRDAQYAGWRELGSRS